MKNISKFLVVSMLALSMVIGMGMPAYAAEYNKDGLVEILEFEMAKETLYRELNEKYPEYQLFSRMSFSKNRHIESLKYLMDKIGINMENVTVEKINIPNTLDESLEHTLKFEKEKLEQLEKIETSNEDKYTNRIIGNLIRSSTRHIETLERAIEFGIDNLNCNNSRNYKNRENFKDFNNGFERRGHSRFGNDWERGFGMCFGGISRNDTNRNTNW